MEQEFSFKELFLYCLRRWYLLVIIFLLSISGFVGYSLINSKPTNIFVSQGTITVKSIDEFKLEGEDLGLSYYATISQRAVNFMLAESVKTRVFEKYCDQLYPTVSRAEKQRLFTSEFKAEKTTDYGITVSFARSYKDDKDKALTKEVVSYYMSQAVIESVQDSALLDGKLTSSALYEVLYVSPDGFSGQIDLTTALLMGGGVGLVLGGLVCLSIFFIDPKIKSFKAISYFAGECLGVIRKDEDWEKCSVDFDTYFHAKGSKIIALTNSNSHHDKAVAETFASGSVNAGRKVLLINMGETDNFSKFLLGEAAIEKIDEYDILTYSDTQQWTKLLSQEKKFHDLSARYDKVIIDIPNNNDGTVGIVTFISDSVVISINQGTTQKKEFLNLCRQLSKEKLAGVVIHSLTNSYVG